jgi:hypothetical protein
MGGHPFPEIPCILCSKPVDLQANLCADENGKPVHEDCYVSRVIRELSNQTAAEKFLAMLSAQPRALSCPKCGSTLSHMDATFFLESGMSCNIPLPICESCGRNGGAQVRTDT